MSRSADWKNSNPLVKAVVLAGWGWFLFCMLLLAVGLLCTAFAGYRFLPSTDWVSATYRVGVVVGGITGLFFFSLALFGLTRKAQNETVMSTWRLASFGISGPVFGYFLGSRVAVVAGPMLLALIAGRHVELDYTVGRADEKYQKHCDSPLEIQGLITGFDKVCGVSDEFRRGLTTGAHIVIAGHGTRYGLFATEWRRDD